MRLSANDVLLRGLSALGVKNDKLKRYKKPVEYFKTQFGSYPVVLAQQWDDLIETDIPEAKLTVSERTGKGFTSFLIAHYFLWTYPKNYNLIHTAFGVGKNKVTGESLWKWVGKIQALKPLKIVWRDHLDDPNTEVFIITVDGTDCAIWEQKHPIFYKDTRYFTKKKNCAGLTYEIGVAIFRDEICWLFGPNPSGRGDNVGFVEDGLRDKIADGKKAVADKGYNTRDEVAKSKLALPNSRSHPAVDKFKSRARCRHESVNGRIKSFGSMAQMWRHGIDKHQMAFEAVVVTIQYQLENGAFLFEV